MKKATRIIIIILAIATLLVIYFPENQVSQGITNTLIRTNVQAPTGDEDADDADMDEETEEDLQDVEDAIEFMLGDDEDEEMNDDADDMDDNGDAMDEEMNDDSEEVSASFNGYMDFSVENLSVALQEEQQVALFFHADWCPTCSALDANLTENEAMLDDSMVVFKVDYDTQEELKTQYGVTSQHTIVYVDNNMNEVNTVRGAVSYSEIVRGFTN